MKKILVGVLAIITLLALPALAQHRDADVVDLRILRSTWGYVTVETAEEFDYGSTALTINHNSTTGTTYGIQSNVASSAGVAVLGEATGTAGACYGAYFETHSPLGSGVYAANSATTGAGEGIYAKTACDYGYGVYGCETADDGTPIGVCGSADQDSGFGGYFVNFATTGNAVGAQGVTSNGSGIVGECTGTAGVGVYGLALNTLGTSYGVLAQANGAAGVALHGAGPITCSEQWWQPLPIISVVGSATKFMDKTNGSWVDNDDNSGDEFFIDFQSLPHYIDGALVHLDSVYLVYSTDAAGDNFNVDVGTNSGACAWLLQSEVDAVGDGVAGCDSVKVWEDDDSDLGSIILAIDPVGTPDAHDIKLYRLVVWYRRHEIPPL